MIQVIATIELKPGCRAEFLEEFRKIVPLVRDEVGCQEYVPFIDLQAPFGTIAPKREDTVVVIEKWSTIEALENHLVAPHMMAYRPKVKHLLENVRLQVLTPA